MTENENAGSGSAWGPSVNRATLSDALIERFDIDRTDARAFVDEFFKLISEHLVAGDTVKIPGLGNFFIRDKVARPGRNLRTGEHVTIGERRVVNFHASGTLNARVTANLLPQEDAAK